MSTDRSNWLAGLPPRLHAPLRRATEDGPANIALMHILMECTAPDEAEGTLSTAALRLRAAGEPEAARRLDRVKDVLVTNPRAYEVVRSVAGALDHGRTPAEGEDPVAYWAAAFDTAALAQPEGSVALYSLGNADLLEAATGEIASRLQDWGAVGENTECLDLGCGIGRFELALAPLLRRIVGIDISAAMLETAARRTAGLRNVEIRSASGRDLADFADASFDLVLAADVFPYLVQAGGDLARTMVSEAARVLAPAGRLVILNYSYRGDLDRDRSEMAALAAANGLETIRNGTSEFTLWDGAVFEMAKPRPGFARSSQAPDS